MIVGLVVLLLTSGLVATGLWLSVGFSQKDYKIYAVYMREAVSGLSEESAVKFNGVRVGFVKNIELNHDDPQQVRLLLNIEKGTPITVSTTAKLISQGITGTTFVGLSADSPNIVLLKKLPGEEYPIIPAKPSLLTQIDKVITEVSKNVNEVAREVKNIFDAQNARYIKKSLANIEEFTQVLAKKSKQIDRSLANADIMLKNIATASKKMPAIMNKFDKGMDGFDVMVKNVSNAGRSVSETMQSGKTVINNFSQQALPPVIALVDKLNSIALNLESVSVQMRRNPGVIIRGSEPPKPGPGER
jgi:phospholipid/cholesterol/gamma-HCH transport system substrate-binding protein